MNKNLVNIQIEDEKSLLEACDLLHDARCDLSTLEVNESEGTWCVKFEREFFEDPTLMKSAPFLFIFTKYTFPHVESQLKLKGIKNYKIIDKSNIGTYTFNECQRHNKVYKLLFCENMEMEITFGEHPSGQLNDLTLLNKEGSYTSFRNPFRS